jgi:CRISPR/Cas system-associated endonuclease Cas1
MAELLTALLNGSSYNDHQMIQKHTEVINALIENGKRMVIHDVVMALLIVALALWASYLHRELKRVKKQLTP